jgi:hypothetical protein
MADANPKELQRVAFGLLGAWICVPIDVDEDEAVEFAKSVAALQFPSHLVRDRLYGGFRCDHPDKRHVYVASGQYTYLGTNSPLSKEDRLDMWRELLENNPDDFLGGGPFCDDAPREEV